MAKMTPVADGSRLRQERERADLTVDALIEVLRDEEGIDRHPDTLRNVELGRTQPGLEFFNALARILGRRTGVRREALIKETECRSAAPATDAASSTPATTTPPHARGAAAPAPSSTGGQS